MKAKAPTFWATLEYLAFPILLLIATPILFAGLGADLYGLWIFLLGCVGLGSLFTLGASSATTRYVAFHSSVDSPDSVAHVVRCSLILATVCVAFPSLLILLASKSLATGWLARLGSASDVTAGLVVLGVLVAVAEIDAVLAGALRGLDQWRANATVELLGRSLLIIGASVIALFHAEPLLLFEWTLSAYLVRLIFRVTILSRQVPTIWHRAPIPRAIFEDIISFGKWQWLQSASAFVFSALDRILVGALLGAAPLARYAVCLQLAQQVHAIPAAGSATLYPKASRLAASNQRISVSQLIRFVLPTATVAVGLATCLIFFGEDFLTIWISEEFAQDNRYLLAYLAVGFLVLAANVVPHYLLLGLGEARFIAILNLAGGLAYVIAILLLLDSRDLMALADARLLYGLLTLFGFLRLWRYVI